MKERWIAVSVTTEEALRLCLNEECRLIAVETPLYPEIQAHWEAYSGIEDYELTVHPKHKCVILKKVRGTHTFDDKQFDIFYYPFSHS